MVVYSRRIRLTLVATMAAVLTLGAVAVANAEPEAGSELHFLNWEEYVDPQVLEDFEAEFGVKVILDYFSDENEMVSIIQADTSRYDLISTSDATLNEMMGQRLIAELDLENIPNLANTDPLYLDLPNDPGNKHSVPYDWGTTGLVYNTDCVQPEAESWSLLEDPRVEGRIGMDTDFSVALGSILKSLGYSQNSGDPAEIEEAMVRLTDLKLNHGMEFVVWNELRDRIIAGDLCVALAFNGDVAVYIDDYDNLGYFVPEEGSDFYLDVLAIPRDAPNKAAAESFMNYLLRPDVHAANNEYTGYAVPNRASIEGGYVEAETLANPIIYPDAANLEAWVPFGNDPERLSLWNEAWSKFLIATS